MTEEKEHYVLNTLVDLEGLSFQCYSRLYLTGVSGAGLWDVTVIHSVSTYNTSPLILRQSMKNTSAKCLISHISIHISNWLSEKSENVEISSMRLHFIALHL